jgi:hypothetical protein
LLRRNVFGRAADDGEVRSQPGNTQKINNSAIGKRNQALDKQKWTSTDDSGSS